jgi:hypothetical protein
MKRQAGWPLAPVIAEMRRLFQLEYARGRDDAVNRLLSAAQGASSPKPNPQSAPTSGAIDRLLAKGSCTLEEIASATGIGREACRQALLRGARQHRYRRRGDRWSLADKRKRRGNAKPRASNRAIADMLGVAEGTVRNDVAQNCAPSPKNASKINAGESAAAQNYAPPLSGAETPRKPGNGKRLDIRHIAGSRHYRRCYGCFRPMFRRRAVKGRRTRRRNQYLARLKSHASAGCACLGDGKSRFRP